MGVYKLDEFKSLTITVPFLRLKIREGTLTAWMKRRSNLERVAILGYLPSLPEELVRGMGKVRDLSLCKTGLRALPKELPRLAQLERLDVRNNKLTRIADDLRKLPALKEVRFEGNPLGKRETDAIEALLSERTRGSRATSKRTGSRKVSSPSVKATTVNVGVRMQRVRRPKVTGPRRTTSTKTAPVAQTKRPRSR